MTRSLALAALLFLIPATARAERRFFPVTGDATIGGSYGDKSQFNANLFLGYSHGVPWKKESLSGLTLAVGPQYTYRSFNRRSVGCRPLAEDATGKTIEKDDGCADGHSIGMLFRVGFAFLTDEDHHVPDHLLYLGVQPFIGREPQLSFEDGYTHTRDTRGVRFTAGYNFFAWSRLIIESLSTEKKEDMLSVLALPMALFNKVEAHLEVVRVQDGRNDTRGGFALGFGF